LTSYPPSDNAAVETALRHVAIIMDGNGRWAADRGLPRVAGHRAGVEAVRRTVRAAIEFKIPWLTLFAFSSENWSRPGDEIDDLMGLMKRFIRQDLAELHQNNVKIKVIGEREPIDAELLALVDEACELTRNNTAITLVMAFNYGSRAEIAKAAKRLAADVATGRLPLEGITPDLIAARLDTGGMPDPDLLIRTSGEQRLSNFLLWQSAYCELVFVPTYWPDFGRETLERALLEYQTRDRRYGGHSRRSRA
jgi:undecaprenyl diphosphate synthase